MKNVYMKPETLARRAAKRKADKAAQYTASTKRLQELVERDGPGSIWQELLNEHLTYEN